MIIGPRYKKARRLGAQIFEKTQTQKFAIRTARRVKEVRPPKTDYGIQMLEKQKVRVTYGVNERQFRNYVTRAVAKRGVNSVELLYTELESRLDNVVYRLGLAPTRAAARQMVSHGHIVVNNRRTTIPSYQVRKDDVISIRAGSIGGKLFANMEERMKDRQIPSWLSFDMEKKTATVTGMPVFDRVTAGLDLGAVIEFYSR
jgi:small subunit ribosomal protein S4